MTQHTELTGTVAAIHLHNTSSGWTVLSLDDGSSAVGIDAEDQLTAGDRYRFGGRWHDHPKYGRQFKWTTFIADMPIDRDGTVRYLAKLCSGIGERTAAALWDRFGDRVLDVLMSGGSEIEASGLLRPSVVEMACETLRDNAAMLRTNVALWGLLGGRGFPAQAIVAMVQRWGVRAPERIRRNPFTLMVARIPGCGFVRCDRLYCDLGGNPKSRKRLLLAMLHGMRGDRNGHTWFTREEVRELLREVSGEVESDEMFAKVVGLGLRSGRLVRRVVGGGSGGGRGEEWLTLREYDEDEGRLAWAVRRLLGVRVAVGVGGVA